MTIAEEVETCQQVLTSTSWRKLLARWRASQRLMRLARSANDPGRRLTLSETRAVIEGLVAGLESGHWGVHRRCKRALETLRAQSLREGVCDVIIERETPRLRDLAVSVRYEPHDALRKAAYLFVLGRQQFYEAHDPSGELLEQFYVKANMSARDHVLSLAKSRGGHNWPQIVLKTLHAHGAAELSELELAAALEVLPMQQRWGELWEIAWTSKLSCSLPAALLLKKASWQPKEARTSICWTEVRDVVPHEADGITVANMFGRSRAIFEGHSGSIFSVTISPDGRTLASGSGDHTIRLWDITNGQQLAVLSGHTNWVRALAFSPDGRTLASGSDDDTIRLWDTASDQQRAVLSGHPNWVRSLAFSPDGRTLASGGDDNAIRLWKTSNGQQHAVFQGHTNSVYSVTFSPDGQTLATGSRDDTIRLWNMARGQQYAVLEGHSTSVLSVAFSPDGQTLASGSHDHTIRLWKTSSGQQHTVLEGHTSSVCSVAFSPDGQMLATGSQDNTVCLWDITRGQQHAVFPGHKRSVLSVVFSPDGRTLVSGSEDQTIRLWEFWRFVRVPLAQMTADDLAFMQQMLATSSLPAEQQAVARYVAAILRYRLGEDSTEPGTKGQSDEEPARRSDD